METTHLSSAGQISIPQSIRDAHHWEAGQEFLVIETGDGVLLKPKKVFPKSSLDQVAGCLRYSGDPKTLDDFEEAIRQGVTESWDDRG
jgi:AbrB family looped-hinge helix DNA binding protein